MPPPAPSSVGNRQIVRDFERGAWSGVEVASTGREGTKLQCGNELSTLSSASS